eukprot:tig00001127_g7155.t1
MSSSSQDSEWRVQLLGDDIESARMGLNRFITQKGDYVKPNSMISPGAIRMGGHGGGAPQNIPMQQWNTPAPAAPAAGRRPQGAIHGSRHEFRKARLDLVPASLALGGPHFERR